MPVFSHSKLNEHGKKIGSKLLIDHLRGVREKAFLHKSKNVRFSDTPKDLDPLLNAISWLHDLGKYTSYFQAYVLDQRKVDIKLKAHSNLGAHTAFQLFRDEPENALLAFYLIKMHHGNLLTFDKVLWSENYTELQIEEQDIFDKQVKNLSGLEELKKEFPAFNAELINLSAASTLRNLWKKELKRDAQIARYFKVNYLFSLLIESDKLDASDTKPYQLTSLPKDAVDQRPKFGKPRFPNKELSTFSQNELRNFVRAEVIENIKRDDILDRRLFTLAAPTGIGKTMTSLDFVLKLREKIENKEGYLAQIIYGLPFINIIEQALSEYETTLGKEKIIGHYQFADIFGKDEPSLNRVSDEVASYPQQKMAWDTWQSDVVITSFVQFFETLIGNRNKLLKKFHHFADSIIILDEVQTLSIEKLPLIGAALYFLCKHLNARILIMTATQPKIFELMERELNVSIDDPRLEPLNLLKRDGEVFSCFNRTKIIPKIDSEIDNNDFIELFDTKWTPSKSCLIVVNKVSRSIEVFNKICALKRKQKFDNPVIYLSTNITPRERRKRVNWLKYKMRYGYKPILISTQVVEAGVDLDFDMGFRDLGPIDSLVQVSGRINRENSEERKGAPLFIVDFGDCNRIYGYVTDAKSRIALNKKEIPENEFKEMVERYFESVSDPKLSDFTISTEIFDAMKNLRYAYPSKENQNKKTVSDFKIIEQSYKGTSVFVELPNDTKATKARKAYQLMLSGKLNRNDFERLYKKDFHQRIIAVPNYLPNVSQLEEYSLSDEILWIKPDLANYYYDVNTGFIRAGEPESIIMF